ncbi:MAG TPA: carboxypeptidase regulatory-like domain-containing protein, partial [Gemmatimonadaceae bacterium]
MLKTGWSFAIAAMVALGTAAASRVAAQGVTTGGIAGIVTSPAGAGIEGAQVLVVNTATGGRVGGRTRANGLFTILGLEVGGPYTITVRRIGFQPTQRIGVTVPLGQTVRVDFRMDEQTTTLSTVQVTTSVAGAVITPTHTGVSTSVSDSSLRRLPSLNRNFSDFVALTPQVSTTLPNGGLSGGGVNNRFNQIEIDGTSETDLFGLGSTGQPGGQAGGKSIGIESVKEYQILLSPFDVRQGNFAGLLVNAVTKSGTNDLHGSAYVYGRNQSFTRTQPYINNFSQEQYGFTLGGPIVKDKVLFFINPEFQRQSAPASGLYFGAPGSNLTQATLTSFQSLLSGYGIPAGGAGQVINTNPLTNVFGRLDFHLPWNTTLVLRDNYGKAVQDNFSRDATGTQPNFPLTSNGYKFQSTKNNVGAQLRTNFANGAFNELLASVTSIRDVRAPNALAPQVTVAAAGEASLVAGGERFSQANQLDQDIAEITDNVTYPVGAHSFTLGATGTFYKVRNLFAQSRFGVWDFQSLDSLKNGLADQYIVGVPQIGDGAVRFTAQTFATYLEDLWTVTDRLTLTYGIRLDVPRFTNRPPTNPDILTNFGRNTADIPSGNIQYSPRIGFNWDMTGDQRNQLRGGLGSFTGHPAYVWLSNAFQNSGLTGVSLLTCNGGTPSRPGDPIPVFNSATIANPPTACGSKTAAASSEVDLLSPNLRFPQDLRASLGYDHSMSHGLIATFEGLYTHAIYAPFYQNIALAGPQGVDRNGRVMYGPAPFAPVLKDAARSTVLDISNENKDYSYNLTAGLQRLFRDNWSGSVFYTFTQARDVQSLTSSTAFSNYRFGRRWAGDESAQTLGTSDFDQPHRIVAHGTYSFRTRTDLSLIYVGSSGTPYDYMYSSDMNGDGQSLNDPIYIPKSALDPTQIQFKDITNPDKSVKYSAATQAQAFDDFIKSTPCLQNNRGRIIPRDACRTPWQNLMNVSVRQSLSTFRGQNISLQLDIFNFLNLVNSNWGHQTFTFSDITLLNYAGLANPKGSLISGSANETQPLYQFTPGQQKFNFDNIDSNYQMQLSLRYS